MARNILVVEDDNNISNLIKMYLDKEGFDVRIAADGGKAVEEFKEKEPDLVLLEISMPRLDGLELLKRLHDNAIPMPTVIILSAYRNFSYAQQALHYGCREYLLKPFVKRELIEQLTLAILSGEYPTGGKLPAVRELAAEAGVNPNTMQKALSELERDGLLYSQRTSGRFVTNDTEKIAALRRDLAVGHIEYFLKKMEELGYTREAALEALKKYTENEGKGENDVQ